MKHLLKIIVLVASLPFMTGFMSITNGSFHCLDFDEIDSQERMVIDKFTESLYTSIKDRQYNDTLGMFHENVIKNTPEQQMEKLLEYISLRLNKSKSSELIEIKLVELEGDPRTNPVICGSVDKNNREYFEVYRVSPSKRFAMAVRSVIGNKVSYNLSFQIELIKEQPPKVIGVSINPSHLSGKGMDYYSSIADEYKDKNELISSYIADTLAISLGQISDFARDKKFLTLVEEVKSFETTHLKSKEFGEWEVSGRKFRVINIGTIGTLSDINPMVSYVSHEKLDGERTKREAEEILAYLKELSPSIGKLSSAILFVAYKEYPEDKNKNYEFYRVPLPLH